MANAKQASAARAAARASNPSKSSSSPSGSKGSYKLTPDTVLKNKSGATYNPTTGARGSSNRYSASEVSDINSSKAAEVDRRKGLIKAGEDVSGLPDVDNMFGSGAAIPEEQVTTSQPTPGQTPVGPQAMDNGAQGAVDQGYVASADEYNKAIQAGASLAERSRAGFSAMQASGAPAPASQGQAAYAMSTATPPAQDFSHVDAMLKEDPGFNDLQNLFKEYFSPETQKTSLVDEYKKMYRKSGLDELDEEILDAKTIIEGTEDDIRNEIQQAGGFGTDSQVQALASSRNKVLLKNYNNLVAMREMKQQNFDTMLSLAQKDREYADQRSDKMLNYQLQVIDYKQKFVDNARSQMVTMGDKLGYDTLYNAYSKDPRQLAFAEQILGLGQGGFQQAATRAQEDRKNQLADLSLDRQYKQAQIANTYSTISERNAQNALVSSAAPTVLKDGTVFVQNGKLTSPQQTKLDTILTGQKLIDQVESLYEDAVGSEYSGLGSGLLSRVKGVVRGTLGIAGANEKKQIYQNFIDSNLTPIAKGLKGEVGAVTDTDKKDAKKSFPGGFSSPAEAKAAFSTLRNQLKDQLSVYGQFTSPQDLISGASPDQIEELKSQGLI